MNKSKYLRKLRKRIEKAQGAGRFEHTLGVAFTAASLAMSVGAPVTAAQTAGLLHDCAKGIPDEKKLRICLKYHIPVSDLEKRNPFLLHAKAGACLAEKKYGVEDRDILNAVRYHTTGRANMSLLEKIIFVADYIEPSRKQLPAEEMQELRKIAFRDLDAALLRILEYTLRYLRSGGGEIDPATEATWRYYSAEAEKHTD